MKRIRPFVSPQVSNEKKKLLKAYLFKENIQRCKLFAKIVVLFESILIVLNRSSYYFSNHSLLSFDPYICMYVTLLVLSIFMLSYIHRFEKKDTYTKREYQMFRFGLLSMVVLFLVWGAVVTLIDQKTYGNVLAFVVNFMCVSILFHASNRTILTIYSLPILVLMIGLPFFQHSSAILFGHYINLTVFLFFCWLASRMLYTSYSTNFYNELLLKEINESLAQKIAENEIMNRKLEGVNEQLKKLTLIDELTQIPNRRGFHQYVAEMLLLKNVERKVSVLMLDIDAFKLFNDHYGHVEGDRVLRLVAQKIKHTLDPSSSITARFGGEEFIVAIFDLDELIAFKQGESIRNAVLELGILHKHSPVLDHISVSIGIVTGTVCTENEIQELIVQADSALYKAKTSGRNRVERSLVSK
ncbi:GGDEF domain-containing protein [Heyndrickxia ginsengihumi]|uniref:GGDEF domain-containing protein n=2 Tax=Heyndrickxia ginsengihumi TaxID=363870 RepID=UPI003D21236D